MVQHLFLLMLLNWFSPKLWLHLQLLLYSQMNPGDQQSVTHPLPNPLHVQNLWRTAEFCGTNQPVRIKGYSLTIIVISFQIRPSGANSTVQGINSAICTFLRGCCACSSLAVKDGILLKCYFYKLNFFSLA